MISKMDHNLIIISCSIAIAIILVAIAVSYHIIQISNGLKKYGGSSKFSIQNIGQNLSFKANVNSNLVNPQK
jgi:hypothetical protein